MNRAERRRQRREGKSRDIGLRLVEAREWVEIARDDAIAAGECKSSRRAALNLTQQAAEKLMKAYIRWSGRDVLRSHTPLQLLELFHELAVSQIPDGPIQPIDDMLRIVKENHAFNLLVPSAEDMRSLMEQYFDLDTDSYFETAKTVNPSMTRSMFREQARPRRIAVNIVLLVSFTWPHASAVRYPVPSATRSVTHEDILQDPCKWTMSDLGVSHYNDEVPAIQVTAELAKKSINVADEFIRLIDGDSSH